MTFFTLCVFWSKLKDRLSEKVTGQTIEGAQTDILIFTIRILFIDGHY